MTPPPDEVWVCFEATRETLEALINAIDSDDNPIGCYLDLQECEDTMTAIRLALERKEQPMLGRVTLCINGHGGNSPGVELYDGFALLGRRVLVVPLEEPAVGGAMTIHERAEAAAERILNEGCRHRISIAAVIADELRQAEERVEALRACRKEWKYVAECREGRLSADALRVTNAEAADARARELGVLK